jgi:hypothetical protein
VCDDVEVGVFPPTDGQPPERRSEEADDRECMEGTWAARDVEDEQHGDGDGQHDGDVQPPEPDVPGIALTAREHQKAEGKSNARSDDMSRSEVHGIPRSSHPARFDDADPTPRRAEASPTAARARSRAGGLAVTSVAFALIPMLRLCCAWAVNANLGVAVRLGRSTCSTAKG